MIRYHIRVIVTEQDDEKGTEYEMFNIAVAKTDLPGNAISMAQILVKKAYKLFNR